MTPPVVKKNTKRTDYKIQRKYSTRVKSECILNIFLYFKE